MLVRERLLLLAAAALERFHESAHTKRKPERKRVGKEERHQQVNVSPADSPRVAPHTFLSHLWWGCHSQVPGLDPTFSQKTRSVYVEGTVPDCTADCTRGVP